MRRILVVGSGISGRAASLSAADAGASVVMLEALAHPGIDKGMLPYLLTGLLSPDELIDGTPIKNLEDRGVTIRLNESLEGIDLRQKRALTSVKKEVFDALVLATGSNAVHNPTQGEVKERVFRLDGVGDYTALGRILPSAGCVAVSGPPLLTILVATILSDIVRVKAFIGPEGLARFSASIRQGILFAADRVGVECNQSMVEGIVGIGRAEAVVSGGTVHACDTVALLPLSSPLVPRLDCELGPSGGIMVDSHLRSSKPDVYACGDCAELRLGSGSIPYRLASAAHAMGSVAGTNAAVGGAAVDVSLSGTFCINAFGLNVVCGGIDSLGGTALGFDLSTFESTFDSFDGHPNSDGFAVSLTYDTKSHVVRGIQVAGSGVFETRDFISTLLVRRATLEELAFQESPYLPTPERVKSPICLTAARALARLRV